MWVQQVRRAASPSHPRILVIPTAFRATIMEACERATTYLRISAAKSTPRSHPELTPVQNRVAERPRIDFVAQAPGRPARVRWLPAAVILVLAGSTARAQPAAANPAPLPLLTKARTAHDMTSEEGARG